MHHTGLAPSIIVTPLFRTKMIMYRNITKRGCFTHMIEWVKCVPCDVKIPRGDYTLKAVRYFTGIHCHTFSAGSVAFLLRVALPKSDLILRNYAYPTTSRMKICRIPHTVIERGNKLRLKSVTAANSAICAITDNARSEIRAAFIKFLGFGRTSVAKPLCISFVAVGVHEKCSPQTG